MLEILINKEDDKKDIALLEDGRLLEYYMEEENSNRNEGNIYVGVVKNVIKGMQAAFVDIGTEKNSFIHLKDILDKIDEKNLENITTNNDKINISDVIKEGQRLLVQVKKDSNLQKGARVSTHINLPSKYIALMPNTDIITVSQSITYSELGITTGFLLPEASGSPSSILTSLIPVTLSFSSAKISTGFCNKSKIIPSCFA